MGKVRNLKLLHLKAPRNSIINSLLSANFEWIKIEDKKDYFVNTMQRELRELRGMKTNFIKVCMEEMTKDYIGERN